MPPAHQRLEAADVVPGDVDDGLIVELELARRKRPAQVVLQGARGLHLHVHRLLEEAHGAAPVALGAIEGKIRVPDEIVGRDAVGGAHGDADRGADDDLVTVDVVGFAQQRDDAVGEDGGIGRAGDGDLDDGELVAPHAGNRVGLAHEGAQPRGHHAEQTVAGGVAEHVVDALEVVEIEHVQGHHFAAPDTGERLLQALVEEHAVGQPGERVMQRHVHDPGLRLALLGDVAVRRHDSAAGHHLRGDGDGAPVAEHAHEVRRALAAPAAGEEAQHVVDVLLGIEA